MNISEKNSIDKIGAVLVLGGGITGIQASLDLAELGFKVNLVEKTSAIGGLMARLDKTFPTNDCSTCILAPKMLEMASHPNIEILTCSEIKEIKGSPGHFEVTILKKARYIDETKCKNCGTCAQNCPVQIPNEFDAGLGYRSAAYISSPQAIPSVHLIDKDNCLYFNYGICRICEKTCEVKAIDFDQKDELLTLSVGSIIIARGMPVYNPSKLTHYGYGTTPDIITALEFERILSASGPFQGHVLRPSDRVPPKKLAFIQCVGSRDRKLNRNFCSSVCCMYAIKEAIIAKEHDSTIDITIFYMDIRAFGKEFDEYYERAKDLGIKFIKSRPSSADKSGNQIKITYETESTELLEELFDLVVLSIGFQHSQDIQNLKNILGLELNDYGFIKTDSFYPIDTYLNGIYVCGICSEPKDIPETVAEASATAGQVSALLAPVRGTMVSKKEYPPELDVRGQTPRIGVFICNCGINIGGIINVPAVVEYAKKLPFVEYAGENLYTCSADTQNIIIDLIKQYKLNRVVVASCSPRTHEPLFRKTIREAGLNYYLFEMTNIRDQCSWVHMHEPEAATEKAKDLVRMAIAKASKIEPLERLTINIISRGLVIGGGVAGMTAALNLARQGFETYLVEKENNLGGFSRNIQFTLENDNVQEFLKTLINDVKKEPRIKLFLNSTIESIDGYVGNYITIIQDSKGHKTEVEHGIVIVATGSELYEPKEYLYDSHPNIVTQLELEQQLDTLKNDEVKKIVMIQCVGSRDEKRPFCNRICCAEAIKNALKIKEIDPNIEIFILYRDIRTYGFKEEYYAKARDLGVNFIHFEQDYPPDVKIENGILEIKVFDELLMKNIIIKPDRLVLSIGVEQKNNSELAKMLKVPLNKYGFFLEAHPKLRPLDFATEGVFLCGTAHWPKFINESIAQAVGAAARAGTILTKKEIEVEGNISVIDTEKCIGCGYCNEICPYNAIKLVTSFQVLEEFTIEVRKSEINPALCKGCGKCVPRCPVQAITQKHFTNEQITLMEEALFY